MLGEIASRNRFRGTRVIRSGPSTVRVFLDRKTLAFLCPEESTKLIVGFAPNIQEIVVAPDTAQRLPGSKVFRNRNGSGRFSKTVSDTMMSLLFPDQQVEVFVPSAVQPGESERTRYVVFKRRDSSLPMPIDGEWIDGVNNAKEDSPSQSTESPHVTCEYAQTDGDERGCAGQIEFVQRPQ